MSNYQPYRNFIEFRYAYGRVLILRDALPTGRQLSTACRALCAVFGQHTKRINEDNPIISVGKPGISVLKKKWLFLEIYDAAGLDDEFKEPILRGIPRPMLDAVYASGIMLADDIKLFPPVVDHASDTLV
jgi:hypothetical protein